MKKLLALVLALVMSLSLVTISNAAYADAADVDYAEAVDVLTEVGVFAGTDGNKFDPKAELTREQAAKIIAYLDLGEKTAEALVGGNSFKDVAASRWSAGYIGYCAQAGYVNGVGNGNFDPTGKLTGLQFAKMLLCALGYEANRETLTGSDWSINTAKLASTNDLFEDIDKNPSAVFTREEAAQMAFNALKADTYEYALDGTTVKGDGFEVITGGSKASTVANKTDKDYRTTGKDNVQQLCEKLYGSDLKLTVTTDVFGRPVNSWKYKTNDIGDYAKAATLVYTGEVKGKEIYADLGNPNLKGIEFDSELNGVYSIGDDATLWNIDKIAKGVSDKGTSKDGRVTEVYYDTDAMTLKVIAYDYFLAKATEDYDTKDEEVDVTVYTSERLTSSTLSADDFAIENVKEDDYLAVTVADGEVQSVDPVTVVAKAQVSVARNDDYVTAAGTKYTYAYSLESDSAALGKDYANTSSNYTLNDTEYNVYLDPNGFVIGVETDDGEVADVSQYLFVEKASKNGFDTIAKVIFTDGTKKTITVAEVDNDDSDAKLAEFAALGDNANTFFKFTTKSNGEYKLTKIGTSTSSTAKVAQGSQLNAPLNDGTKPITGKAVVANNATVYLTKSTVFTGVKNAPKVTATDNNTYYLFDNNGILLFVYATKTGAASTNTDDYVYILSNNYAVSKDGDDTYYIYTAIVKGEKTTLNANDALDKDKAVGLFKIETYTDGRADLKVANKVTASVKDEAAVITGVTSAEFKNNVLNINDGAAAYVLTDDCIIRTVDGTTVKTISASSIKANVKDGFDDLYMLQKSSDNDDIVVVYLVK